MGNEDTHDHEPADPALSAAWLCSTGLGKAVSGGQVTLCSQESHSLTQELSPVILHEMIIFTFIRESFFGFVDGRKDLAHATHIM